MASLFVNEGLKWLLDALAQDGKTIEANATLHLYKVAKVPAAGDVLADYTAIEADFNGYAAQPVAFAQPAGVQNGIAAITAETAQWTKGLGGVGNNIYGWFLADIIAGKLIAAGDDPIAPINMNTDNNTYSVQLTFTAARG